MRRQEMILFAKRNNEEIMKREFSNKRERPPHKIPRLRLSALSTSGITRQSYTVSAPRQTMVRAGTKFVVSGHIPNIIEIIGASTGQYEVNTSSIQGFLCLPLGVTEGIHRL